MITLSDADVELMTNLTINMDLDDTFTRNENMTLAEFMRVHGHDVKIKDLYTMISTAALLNAMLLLSALNTNNLDKESDNSVTKKLVDKILSLY